MQGLKMRCPRKVFVSLLSLSLFAVAAARAPAGPVLFDIPLRINMGGVETIDSHGNTWLGDGPGTGDPLNIRVNDASGVNTIENWGTTGGAGPFDPSSLSNIGFDPSSPDDQYIFDGIRWDVGGDGIDFRLEIPVPSGQYIVNCYFTEECCTFRHFKIEIQGDIMDDDVSYLDYDETSPGIGRAGRLSFPGILVSDDILAIGFLPCPECPGATDTNAIIDALEVLPDSNCTAQDFNFRCMFDPGTDRVNATWETVDGADGYRVLKNGEVLFNNLPGNVTSFTDTNPRSGGDTVLYALQALDGGSPFAECTCRVNTFACPSRLQCTFDRPSGEARLSWRAGINVNVTGFEIRGNGLLLATLGAAAVSYVDNPTERSIIYEVTPLTDPAGECRVLTCSLVNTSFHFDIPFRVNAGGPEVTDSSGRVWLGDEGAGLDPLGIRPVDGGGANTIGAGGWCSPDPARIDALGFDSTNPGDVLIFQSIRWDTGTDGVNFNMEIPVENGMYDISMYFCEACCPARHWQIEIEGEIVAPDVNMLSYADGLHQPGRLRFFGITVADDLLNLNLLPCPACPGAGDVNAILTAFEVLPSVEDPCTIKGFRQCPANLACSVAAGGAVTGTWDPPLCVQVTSYELRKDGAFLQSLPGNATSFNDTLTAHRVAVYDLIPILAAGELPCRSLQCTATNEAIPFEIPLRINMGGRDTIDSNGNRWFGDPGAGADVLSIRPNDAGGFNVIENWCDRAALVDNFDSLQSLGFDPFHRADLSILDSIRWDVGDDDGDGIAGELNDLDGGDIDYIVELPIPNGSYLLNLYFTECCCPLRDFQIEVQGELVKEHVSTASYSLSGALGRTGRFSFDGVGVTGGILQLALRPCPDCPIGTDTNAILDAIEVLPAGTAAPRCPSELVCSRDFDGNVTGTWVGPDDVTLTGYKLLRNGEEIVTLAANATSFLDANPACARATTYELKPQFAGSNPCPDLRLICTVIDPLCPFLTPLRINMGARQMIDSRGEIWIGDPSPNTDVLEIRPDDSGGGNAEEYWFIGNYQPSSLVPLGFDPDHLGNEFIFNSIRWDDGGFAPDFRMEIPLEDGEYDVNMYFNENCCIARHFQIEIQGEIVDADVSYLDYVPDAPALGKLGILAFPDVAVSENVLSIALLPCPDPLCAGSQDINAILNGLEILGGETPPPGVGPFLRGDCNQDGRNTGQVTDGVFLLNFIFLGGASPRCRAACDMNGDGAVAGSPTDAIFYFNFNFLGGPPLPDPLRTCARSTRPGDINLGCADPAGCVR